MSYTLLVIKFWREALIAVLLVALSVALFTVYYKDNAIDDLKAEYALERAVAESEHQAQARQIEQQNYQGVIDAINQSTERQKAIADKYDNAIVVNDSLQSTIYNIESTLINANRTAILDYTKSVNGLFAECSSRYLEMAKNAAREQEEARRVREAWRN